MLLPFGTLAATRVDSDFELISSEILTGTQGSVVFSNLGNFSSTYKHLQVRMTARSNHAGAAIITIRLNGDTGNSYAWHSMFGNGSSVGAGAVSSTNVMDFTIIPSATEASNAFSACVVDLLDVYSTAKNKTVRLLNGSSVSGANRINFASGARFNTASLTEISFSTYASYVAGSRFSLYGIRG
jgi:hypothetical protein